MGKNSGDFRKFCSHKKIVMVRWIARYVIRDTLGTSGLKQRTAGADCLRRVRSKGRLTCGNRDNYCVPSLTTFLTGFGMNEASMRIH